MAAARKIRYAVVGMGWFAQEAVLPGFRNARANSELAALVSGDPEKREELGRKYSVPAYAYEQYDELLARREIDAVYIVLPNSEHHPYTLSAVRHGVHVLCEKPLAGSAAEAKEMIEACARAGVRLMTAYRLHFQPANLSVVDLLQAGAIGGLRTFHGWNTQNVDAGNSRLQYDLAGGPLRDIGIYCINAARYLFQSEPIEVCGMSARSADPRFAEVPEMVSAVLRFPEDRLATFTCGFGEGSVSRYDLVGTTGDVQLERGFSFSAAMTRTVTRGDDRQVRKFRKTDQVGPEILHFSECILSGRESEASGLEGLIDLEIIEAIEQSVQERRSIPLDLPQRVRRPEASQEIEKPATAKPKLVNADAPK
jgi:glucose-fructose oxidoreductase